MYPQRSQRQTSRQVITTNGPNGDMYREVLLGGPYESLKSERVEKRKYAGIAL